MFNESSIFQIPNLARRDEPVFGAKEDLMIFAELNEIAEEVERCRQSAN